MKSRFRFTLAVQPSPKEVTAGAGYHYTIRDRSKPKGARIVSSGYWGSLEEITKIFKDHVGQETFIDRANS